MNGRRKKIVAIDNYVDPMKIGTTEPQEDRSEHSAPSAPSEPYVPPVEDDDYHSAPQSTIPKVEEPLVEPPRVVKSQVIKRKGGASAKPWIVLSILIAALAGLGTLLFGARYPEIQYVTVFQGFTWKCDSFVSEFKDIPREGFEVPSGAFVQKTVMRERTKSMPAASQTVSYEVEVEEPYDEIVDVPYEVEVPQPRVYKGTNRVYYDDGSFEDVDHYEEQPPRREMRVRQEVIKKTRMVKKAKSRTMDVVGGASSERAPYYYYTVKEWADLPGPFRHVEGQNSRVQCATIPPEKDGNPLRLRSAKRHCEGVFVVQRMLRDEEDSAKNGMGPGEELVFRTDSAHDDCSQYFSSISPGDYVIVNAKKNKVLAKNGFSRRTAG